MCVVRDARLVAYVQWRAAEITSPALDRMLGDRLPDYMIPAAYVALDDWPLTPSGKLDRLALPAPCFVDRAATGTLSPLEARIAGIWGELLGVAVHSADADFFDLGGTSCSRCARPAG
ncbi:MAG: phosphopantetheine-binding protein [Kofleriaceae bacterium]